MTTRSTSPFPGGNDPEDDRTEEILPLGGESELDSSVLERYWLRETSAEETAAVDAWLAAYPRRRVRAEQLRGYLKASASAASGDEVTPSDVRRIITSVLATTDRSTSGVSLPRTPVPSVPRDSLVPRTTRPIRTWLALGLVALVLFLGWQWNMTHTGKSPSVAGPIYATANGQRAFINLADGSRVVLDVASRIEVPTDFGPHNRTVRLQGEAFFTIAHQRGAPFTVIAGPSVTRVLGTSFIVRDYATDTAATITVRDGKVAVQSTVVTAMRQVAAGPKGVGRIQPADLSRFNFTSGVLTFANTPLIDAIPELNRWYDVEIRLGDAALATRKVVGGFRAGSPTDLRMMLGWTFNVRVVQNGRTLTLYPKD